MVVTCCFCEPQTLYGLDFQAFLQDVNALMLYTTPFTICVVLWKIFVTNRRTPRGNMTVLGLDDSSATYSPPAYGPGLSGWALLLYLFTGVLTFALGVSLFNVVQSLS